MEIRKNDKTVEDVIDGERAERSELSAKIQRLHIFFSLLIPDMTHEERQLLDEALIQTYAGKGITHQNESLYDEMGSYKTMPVLGDLYDVLKKNTASTVKYSKVRRKKNFIMQKYSSLPLSRMKYGHLLP